MKQTFSLKEVVITALVGFLLSGIGGALFNDYLSRAKPAIVVENVSFEGPAEPIETSADLRSLAAKSHFFQINKYASYSELTQHEAEVQQNLQLLRTGLDATTTWLARAENSGIPPNTSRMTLQDEESSPFYENQSIASTLLTQYHLRVYTPPPNSLAAVRRSASLGTVSQDESAVNVDFGSSSLKFPFDSADDDYRGWVRLLAESFAYGDRTNIVHYHRTFSESAGPLIRSLEQLQGMLRELIYANARLNVALLFSNSGGKLVVMKPVFALIIDHPDFKQPFVLTTVSTKRQTVPGEASQDVKVIPVLPEATPVPSFNLKPGEAKAIHAVGLSPLDKDAKSISDKYASGLLRCKAVAFTRSGIRVESDTSPFGSRINPDDLTAAQSLTK
jgi:hypothetical protein